MKRKNGSSRLLYIILALILVAGLLFVRNGSQTGKELTDQIISQTVGAAPGPSSANEPDGPGETTPANEAAQPEDEAPDGEGAAPVSDLPELPAEEIIEEEPPEESTAEDSPEASGAVASDVPQDEPRVSEDGEYDSKEDVALYLHLYHRLPSNYITKKNAKAQGWSGNGSDRLDRYCPGKCIGGDYFGNYEGVLPKGEYHECDIDTMGAKSRGVKRIVYSSDWRIYYTEDHYESFELLYEP